MQSKMSKAQNFLKIFEAEHRSKYSNQKKARASLLSTMMTLSKAKTQINFQQVKDKLADIKHNEQRLFALTFLLHHLSVVIENHDAIISNSIDSETENSINILYEIDQLSKNENLKKAMKTYSKFINQCKKPFIPLEVKAYIHDVDLYLKEEEFCSFF